MKKGIVSLLIVVVVVILIGFSCKMLTIHRVFSLGKKAENIGNGEINIFTPNGNSSQEEIPIVFTKDNNKSEQIALVCKNLNNDLDSYIFIDGKEVSKLGSNSVNTALTLTGKELNVGVHKLEVVQFDNNKISGKIKTYKVKDYKVEEMEQSLKVGTPINK
ncbi:MAG: hypothetical protein ACRDD2_04205 [Sarcina sp.]